MTQKVQSYLKEIKAAILAVAPEAEIILFGSQARGDAREDSDIDLLVLVDGAEKVNSVSSDIIWAAYEIQMKYMVEINPVVRDRKEWYHPPFRTPFYINVINEGVRV